MRKLGHKIILEGCDGTGKTTLANQMIEESPDMKFKIVHCSRHTENTYKFFMNLLKSKDNLILDRAFIGQFIYNTKEDRKKNGWLTDKELRKIERFINKYHEYITVVYINANDDAILQNCEDDVDDSYYTIEYIRDIKSRYNHYFMNSDLKYHVTKTNIIPLRRSTNDTPITEEEMDRVTKEFDYSSLPKIIAVDFDGTIASNAFPHINEKTTVNQELVNRLIDARKNGKKLILWTNRTGSSLVEACNFCADLGLTFDEVNANIEEVRTKLFGGPRKVYADYYIDDKSVLPDQTIAFE